MGTDNSVVSLGEGGTRWRKLVGEEGTFVMLPPIKIIF